MKKIISITGSSSFLGREVQSLLEKKFALNLFTRSLKEKKNNKNQTGKLFMGNLQNKNLVIRFLKKSNFVINIAFDSYDLKKNIKIINNLIYASNKSKTIKKFIHISTAVVVGKSYKDEVNEFSKSVPLNNYQKIKLKLEKKLINQLSNNIELIILRPTEIANYKNPKSTIFYFDKRCKDNILNFFFRWIFSSRILNFVSIENVARSIVFFITTKMKYGKKNIFFISEDKKTNNFAYFFSYLKGKKIYSFFFNNYLIKNLIKFIFFNILKKPNPYQIYSNNRLKKLGFKFNNNSIKHLKKLNN